MDILIAEDSSTSRMMLEGIVRKFGFRPVCVEDGVQAWETLQKPNAPRLLLLDWMMPGLSGTEICRKLRASARPRSYHLILLTAKVGRGNLIQGLEAGADDYITKPFDAGELRARLEAGRRALELQDALAQQEKLQGVIELAGAICHELNQPLQAVSGWCELLLNDMPESDPHRETLRRICGGVQTIGELTGKIMRMTSYETKPYMNGRSRIIDIHQSVHPREETHDERKDNSGG